ncbi:MAG: metallophosphoesterase family protein [Deltaproteobacteria bacterium]|nr:metallophosphoesterase family protein [Deltaproteobacteria bacterium]
MRYAILSDIHANLEALNSVLEKIDSLGVDKTVCLGDIVGYNSNPNECIEIIKKRGIHCIMGNHDSRAAGIEEPRDFNPMAAEALYWTRKELTANNRDFLEGLPRKSIVDNAFLAFHGWINSTDGYIFSENDAAENFKLMDEATIAFFGHTHVRLAYVETGGRVTTSLDHRFKLEKGLRYLVNPGGAGQPRDRDPRAPFLVYDHENGEITFYRVEYDMEKCAEKILLSGLPATLAERLKSGR